MWHPKQFGDLGVLCVPEASWLGTAGGKRDISEPWGKTSESMRAGECLVERGCCARWVPQRGSRLSLEQEAASENLKRCQWESSWLLGRAWEQGCHGGHGEGCPLCTEGHPRQAELKLLHSNKFISGNPIFTGFSPSIPSTLPLLLHLLRTVRHPKPSHFHELKSSRAEGSQPLLPLPNVPSTGRDARRL